MISFTRKWLFGALMGCLLGVVMMHAVPGRVGAGAASKAKAVKPLSGGTFDEAAYFTMYPAVAAKCNSVAGCGLEQYISEGHAAGNKIKLNNGQVGVWDDAAYKKANAQFFAKGAGYEGKTGFEYFVNNALNNTQEKIFVTSPVAPSAQPAKHVAAKVSAHSAKPVALSKKTGAAQVSAQPAKPVASVASTASSAEVLVIGSNLITALLGVSGEGFFQAAARVAVEANVQVALAAAAHLSAIDFTTPQVVYAEALSAGDNPPISDPTTPIMLYDALLFAAALRHHGATLIDLYTLLKNAHVQIDKTSPLISQIDEEVGKLLLNALNEQTKVPEMLEIAKVLIPKVGFTIEKTVYPAFMDTLINHTDPNHGTYQFNAGLPKTLANLALWTAALIGGAVNLPGVVNLLKEIKVSIPADQQTANSAVLGLLQALHRGEDISALLKAVKSVVSTADLNRKFIAGSYMNTLGYSYNASDMVSPADTIIGEAYNKNRKFLPDIRKWYTENGIAIPVYATEDVMRGRDLLQALNSNVGVAEAIAAAQGIPAAEFGRRTTDYSDFVDSWSGYNAQSFSAADKLPLFTLITWFATIKNNKVNVPAVKTLLQSKGFAEWSNSYGRAKIEGASYFV